MESAYGTCATTRRHRWNMIIMRQAPDSESAASISHSIRLCARCRDLEPPPGLGLDEHAERGRRVRRGRGPEVAQGHGSGRKAELSGILMPRFRNRALDA